MTKLGTKSGIRASWVIALLACAVCSTAFARDEIPLRPGEKVYGLLDANESVSLGVLAAAGSRLTLKLSVWRGSTLLPSVQLTDPDGQTVYTAAYLRIAAGGRRLTLAAVPLSKSGVYHYTISGTSGTSGGFDLSTVVRRSTKLAGRGVLTGPAAPVQLPFAAVPGDVVSLIVKPHTTTVVDFVGADASTTIVNSLGRAGPFSVSVAGDQRFDVVGIPGKFTYAIKVIPAKPSKLQREVHDLLATGTISGTVIVEGQIGPVPTKRASNEKRARRSPAHGAVVPGEVIVSVPNARSDQDVVDALGRAVPGMAYEVLHRLTDRGPYLVRVAGLSAGPSRRAQGRTASFAKALRVEPAVRWAEPNAICSAAKLPNDALWSGQDDFRTIQIPAAWDITTGSPSVVIAVVDTGIWVTHPDFAGRLLPGFDFVTNATRAADGDGWDADPTDSNHEFHGTHVAGTIGAASNNRVGVAGVAWACPILPVRVLGNGGGTDFDIAAGIRWAAGLSVPGAPPNANPARVINLSIAGYGTFPAEADAIQSVIAAGVCVVAAAGNDDTDAPAYPASFPGVISVSAVAPDLSPATYSNYGDSISVCAPGGDQTAGMSGILSTFVDPITLQPTYRELQGTSMASPHVAGVVGLVLSVNSTLTPAQVKTLLETTSFDLGDTGFDIFYGHGLVDAEAAVRAAKGAASATPILAVTPQTLDLGPGVDAATIYVRNNGQGSITVSGVSVATDDAGAWLQATRNGTSAPSTVGVTVLRGQLSTGLHTGHVTIFTSSGDVSIPVRVLRSDPVDIGTITVAAVRDDNTMASSTTTSLAQGYAFVLSEVPQGTYSLKSWLDQNGDNLIDRVDEWWGEWPVTSSPSTLSVAPGNLAPTGLNFPVQRFDQRFQYDGAGGGSIHGAVAVRVTDSTTHEPIVGAAAYIGSAATAATTDSRGRAVLGGSLYGPQTVTIAAPGYGTLTQIGSDAQYQSFALAKLGTPPTFTTQVTVTGLEDADFDVYVQVGDSFASTYYVDVSGEVTVSVAVPQGTEELPVWALVKDINSVPVKVALGTISGVTTPTTISASIYAYRPNYPTNTYWYFGSRVVSLPQTNFQSSGASLSSLVGLYWDSQRSLLLGLDDLKPGQASDIRWVSFGSLDSQFAASIQLYAEDVLGRTSSHFATGKVNALSLPTGVTLKSPSGLIAPASGVSVFHNAPTFSFSGSAGAQAHEVDIVDAVTGDPVWTIQVASSSSSATLPAIPTGGLVPGRGYRWSVESFFIPGFDYANYLDDAFLTGVSDTTTSEARAFTAQ
jgi:serine protease